MNRLKINWAFLPADDPEKSLVFYRDVLGFEVHNDVGRGTMRWITLGLPGQDVQLVLAPPGAGESQADQETIKDLMAKGIFATLVLGTDAVDATFEQIAASGAEVVQEPIDQPYGVRDCAFRDPAGNLLRFNETTF